MLMELGEVRLRGRERTHRRKSCTCPDATNGTAIYADQFGWLKKGVNVGIYGSPMECLGEVDGHGRDLFHFFSFEV